MYTCTKVTFRLLLLTDEIKSRVVVIYNRAIVAVTSEWCVNCNTWTGLNTGTLANSADPDQIFILLGYNVNPLGQFCVVSHRKGEKR